MAKVKCYKWNDAEGLTHVIPDGSCVICSKCRDIFLDPFKHNEIYACVCSIADNESSELSRKCPDFELDTDIEGVIYMEEGEHYDN